MTRFNYPTAPTSDQVDDYHGTPVPDPYRPLEDPDSPETRAWIETENRLTFDFLSQIPARAAIRARLTGLWDFPRRWAPLKRGDRYFQLRNSGLQNQDALYVMDDPRQEGRILLDPNGLSADGTVALNTWSVSDDGEWLAYAVSASGSDWLSWRIRRVATGEDLPETLEWSKFSGAAWKPDSSGFYYARYAPPQGGEDYTGVNYYQKLYFHRLDEPQSQDALVYERPDQKEWGFAAEVSQDGRYLVMHVWLGTDVRNRLFYQDLQSGGPVVELIPELEAAYSFIGSDGDTFYLSTNFEAPRSRLVAIDLARPDKSNWQTVIPEGPDAIEGIVWVNDEFITLTLHDAYHRLTRYDRRGRLLGEIPLPAMGTVPAYGNFLNLTGRRADKELFYGFWSFLYPITLFRFDFERGESEQIFQPALDFAVGEYVTRQVFVPRPDGARVPLFLTHRRDLVQDGQNPTLLYGYGGFTISLTPAFAVYLTAWLEMGGVLAWSNLRGGGEYGEEWHQAGMLANKQTVFDDFIACAEYLIAEKITSTPRLAIYGRSNGGLLVGACLAQRPDLFGAALPAVGVMDMLRFHRFTIGWAWVSEYGCADNPQDLPTLVAYSPLHNLKPGAGYPPTLVTTADHDDRVVPGHSFKFAAALQAAQGGEAPVLIRIQTKAGHGMGKPTAMQIEEYADMWAFLAWALKME